MRDGPAIPSSESLCVASLNARRLWQRDQSVHDGFRVFSDFLLENHVGVVCIQAVFAGDFPTLPSDQPCTFDGPVGSEGREKQHFWFVQACVVLLSREWRIQPVSGGGCSTMLGASVHTTLLMQGCHRRPVSVFGRILSLLLSVCRMQSAFQWSSPETATCGIFTSTSLDPDRAMCVSSLFWICSWLLADWSCAILLIEQPTSRALDKIASSSLPVMLWTLWCTMGCNVAQVPLCVAQCWGQTISCASQLVCLFPHVQTQCVDQRCRHCAIGDPL